MPKCVVTSIVKEISREWALEIIRVLTDNNKLRYSEIQNLLNGISPKTLSNRLKELGACGIISRTVYPETPPKVEYSLTPKGRDLERSLQRVVVWVKTYSRPESHAQ